MLGGVTKPQLITPNLDAFAATGVRFNHCVSSSPLCTPFRGLLLSGRHPLRSGAVENDVRMLPGDGKYFAQVLRDAGFAWNVLYDHERDPGEVQNLYYDYESRELRKRLHEQTLAWMNRFGDPGATRDALIEACARPGEAEAWRRAQWKQCSGTLAGRPADMLRKDQKR